MSHSLNTITGYQVVIPGATIGERTLGEPIIGATRYAEAIDAKHATGAPLAWISQIWECGHSSLSTNQELATCR